MKFHLMLFAIGAFILSSCGSTKNNNSMDNPGKSISEIPTGTFWKLEKFDGKDYSDFNYNGKEVGFTLEKEDNRITGFAGCNSFFGTYELEAGNRIRFSAIGSTRMACPDSNFKENDFLEIFTMADNYTINDNMLSINVGRRAPLAVFKKVEMSQEDIINKHWKLTTLKGQKVIMGKDQERESYITLTTQDNQFNGFGGCNIISGKYDLEENNKITFSGIISTLRACIDGDNQESEFMKTLNEVDSYTIKGDELWLNIGGKKGVATFEAIYF